MPTLSPAELSVRTSIQAHQETATLSRLPFPSAVRTLVQHNHGYAVISTNSLSDPGYPGGSVVGFAPDSAGRPIMLFSTMSGHTRDLLEDPRCSLTVADIDFKGAADGRVNLQGKCEPITDPADIAAAQEVYKNKHPNAFWMSFGDFTMYRMEVSSVRFVGGFAMAGGVTGPEYAAGIVDPIKQFSRAICEHMNGDHEAATIAIVKSEVDIDVDSAKVASVDSRGMEILVGREDGMKLGKLRIPWEEEVKERGDVKTQIVKLTKKASAAAQ